MLVRPRLVHLVAAGIAVPLLSVAAASAAAAHGAPLNPVSRAAACGSEGEHTKTAACRAARAGSQGQWFDQWDNVRVAGVNGQDRDKIPDGKLCSGGIANFGGLDLPRSDWPSTTVRAGRAVTVRYRATIAHQGAFRMYITKDGYDPKRKLRWSDLASKPFVTAKDPRFNGSAYTFDGRLPKGKTGRHVILTIWQNSSTPDTYYSCSDVTFTKPARSAPAVKPKPRPTVQPSTVKPRRAPRTRAPEPVTTSAEAAPADDPSATEAAPDTLATSDLNAGAVSDLNPAADRNGSSISTPVLAGVGLFALAGTAGVALLTRRRRRRPRPAANRT
jgi:predicted carbohydrate-binding protein with CBM5 and CBM33 domain